MDHEEGWLPWRAGRVDTALLIHVPLLAGVSENRLLALAESASWRSYRRGEPIAGPESDVGVVHILVRGTGFVGCRSPKGDELVVFRLGPGDLIDFADVPATVKEDAYAEAAEEGTVVCRFPRQLLHEAIFATPSAAAALYHQLRQRFMELGLLFWEQISHDALTRLWDELQRLAESDPERMVWATHGELAQRIGASREAVTRLLPKLEQQGLIAYGRHRRGIKVLCDGRPAGLLRGSSDR